MIVFVLCLQKRMMTSILPNTSEQRAISDMEPIIVTEETVVHSTAK